MWNQKSDEQELCYEEENWKVESGEKGTLQKASLNN